ncbi:MAG: rod shape-determining protein RodA [Candidatus Pacebacteria bacterium]|nr:rod shape-determining protein RodA [Candidatus Paceibacterota bacterium]
MIQRFFRGFDWSILLAVVPLLLAGMTTMVSFSGDASLLDKQLLWVFVGIFIALSIASIDVRFLRDSRYVVISYILSLGLLVAVLIFGKTVKGAKSWFDFGGFSFQPTDIVKLLVIIVLAKYFSRRHVAIAQFKHLAVSFLYAILPIGLILLQPDFGSAMVVGLLWIGMALVSGISRKHILMVFGVVVVAFSISWLFLFKPYQKDRIISFIHPTSDIRGSGYNAYQSVIAVGSGQIFGKGLGYGTQSRLNFLPEYQTDFVFAAFSEEWGFVGSLLILFCFCFLLWRVKVHASRGASNFETLFCVGYMLLLFGHIIVNIGMNIGIMPVTGIPLPFMSYGGSHLLGEFIGLGIVLSMTRYERAVHRGDINKEFIGYA